MVDKAETSTSSAAMATNVQGYQDILTQNHLLLMETLDPHLFLDMLDPFLICGIDEKITKEEKTRQLLEKLSRAPVKMFDKFCKVIAGLHPHVFRQLQGREPTREEADFFFKSFYEDLCAGIIDGGSKTDNEVDKKIDLDTQFVNLKLTHREFDEVDSTASSYKGTDSESSDTDEDYDAAQDNQLGEQKVVDKDIDVSKILPQNFSGKSVLLQGKAGVGKSTLTQYVAREWAKGRWGTAFTGVFLLNLRKLVHVKQEMSLSQLLGMYAEYVTGEPDPDKPSIEWLEQNAEKVLIFTDGINELPELSELLERTPNLNKLNLKATPLDWCINLIQKNVLPQCTTVVVSRPFIGLRKLKYDREIEVIGLSPDMVMQFVEKNVESSRKEAVKETLLKNPLLLSVCTVTFYCSALCKVLEQDMSLDRASLATYTRITAYLIRKFVSRNTAEESTLSVTPEEFSECLMELAALAYYGLLGSGQDNTHLVFDQTDFNHVDFPPSKMKAAKKTGLLLYKDVKTVLSPQLQAEFVHLSIQEFLAMASLAKAEEHEVRQFFKSSLGRFNMSKLFAYGIFLDKENPDIQAIHQTVMRDTDTNVQRGKVPIADILVDIFQDMCKELDNDDKSQLTLMHIAHESQSVDLALTIGKAVAPEGEFELKLRQLTLIDLRAIFFCLTHAKVHKVTCRHIMVDHILVQEIHKYLNTTCETITLEFNNTNLTDNGMSHLAEGIKTSTHLRHLRFAESAITDHGMYYLAQGIIHSTSLNSLSFLCDPISDRGMDKLAQGIAGGTSLTTVSLHHSEVSDEGWRLLSEGIKITKCLQCLELVKLDITETGINHLAEGIKISTSLKKVSLQAVRYTASTMQALCEGMASDTNPKQLHIVNYSISSAEMRFLSNGYKRATQLNHLLFKDCSFTKNQGSMRSLSEGIHHLTVLQFQRIHFTDDPMGHLSEAISTSPSIQKLTFEECVFSDHAMELLFNGIASSGITHLELAPTKTQEDIHVPGQLAFSDKLVHITLGGFFPEASFHLFSGAISCSKGLSSLELKTFEFSSERMRLLCKAISASTSLRELQLSGCRLDTQDMQHLTRALKATRRLRLLVK